MPKSIAHNMSSDEMTNVEALSIVLVAHIGEIATIEFSTMAGEERVYRGEIVSVDDSASGGTVTIHTESGAYKRAILPNVYGVEIHPV